ncbi:MAG TPA: preprotein translocase subunit YajC [Gemmatimonadaceae bacterium]|nr:preprotein translocase subunit YajC [Gemmatimonadaceae bacterium]
MIAHLWLLSAPIVAQAATKAPGGFGSYPLILDGVLIAAMFYFLLWRPQKTQRKQKEEMLRKLKKGDEVTTAGGIVGEVIHIKETVKDGASAPAMDDRVTIKSAESRIVVERGSVARVTSKAADSGSSTS